MSLHDDFYRCLQCDDFCRTEDVYACESCGYKFCSHCIEDHAPECLEALNQIDPDGRR